jgi:hypothetical protein
VAAEKKLSDVPEFKALLQSFITQEIMPWTKVEAGVGPMLKDSGYVRHTHPSTHAHPHEVIRLR